MHGETADAGPAFGAEISAEYFANSKCLRVDGKSKVEQIYLKEVNDQKITLEDLLAKCTAIFS
jgi:hypothetical protein